MSEIDDFYADISGIETKKYLLVKARDIYEVKGYINNHTVSLPTNLKQRLSKIYSTYTETLLLFVVKNKDDKYQTSKDEPLDKAIVVGTAKIISEPKISRSNSLLMQVEWLYTYTKSIKSLRNKFNNLSKIFNNGEDMTELEEDAASNICTTLKVEAENLLNKTANENTDKYEKETHKINPDTAVEFADYYNAVKSEAEAKRQEMHYQQKQSRYSDEEYKDKYYYTPNMVSEAKRTANEHKLEANESDEEHAGSKRKRSYTNSEESSRRSIKDRKRRDDSSSSEKYRRRSSHRHRDSPGLRRHSSRHERSSRSSRRRSKSKNSNDRDRRRRRDVKRNRKSPRNDRIPSPRGSHRTSRRDERREPERDYRRDDRSRREKDTRPVSRNSPRRDVRRDEGKDDRRYAQRDPKRSPRNGGRQDKEHYRYLLLMNIIIIAEKER